MSRTMQTNSQERDYNQFGIIFATYIIAVNANSMIWHLILAWPALATLVMR